MNIENEFSKYTITPTLDTEHGVLYVEFEYYDKIHSTTKFDVYSTMDEVDQFIERNNKKQTLLSIIESLESTVTGYYGDDIDCITDDSYECLAEAIIDKL
jgi:hypothetical protein